MPAHAKAYARIDRKISEAVEQSDARAVDHYLDQRHQIATGATEWDADKWGFDPGRWCEAERVEMERRAAGP